MHKLNHTPTTIADGLVRAAYKLHETKRNFLSENLDTFNSLYATYDQYASAGTLHLLTPYWGESDADTPAVKQQKQEKRELAKSLYGSKRPIINKHWEELKTANGGGLLICPICGMNECTEMDHYIPISVMQEYSVHLTNLIPLCHYCNHQKLDKWLDDNTGERLIFNAYFDGGIPSPLLVAEIRMNPNDHLPEISAQFSNALQAGLPAHRIINSTLTTLELINEYRSRLRVMFDNELIRMRCQYESRPVGISGPERWADMKTCYRDTALRTPAWDVLNLCMINAILKSQDMEQWLLSL